MVKTAVNLNLRPTALILRQPNPHDGWTDADYKLVMAWQMLQDETCPQCGEPIWVCRSENPNLFFTRKTGVCYKTAEREKWEKKNGEKWEKKKAPGEYVYFQAEMFDNKPLPSRREYIEQEAEKLG